MTENFSSHNTILKYGVEKILPMQKKKEGRSGHITDGQAQERIYLSIEFNIININKKLN
jgi:hypothetical protein